MSNPNEGPCRTKRSGGRGTGGPSPPCPPAVRFPNRSGTAPRSSSSGTMRYPTAWCAEIRPRPKRSTPSISPIRPEIRPPPRARGASLHSAGRLPRPLVAPLRSKSLGARAGRSRSRAHDRDRSRHRDDTAAPRRSPRRSTAPRRWWNHSNLVGRRGTPRSHPKPALPARA